MKDKVHDMTIDKIKDQLELGKTWDQIRRVDIFGADSTDFKNSFNMAKTVWGLEYDYSEYEWNILVNHIREEHEGRNRSLVKIEKATKNNASISRSPRSAWQLYRKGLLDKGWTRNSIENIQESSFGILQLLSQDTIKSGPVKGLVVGNVQSGKTANMAGLISMAADYGFNYFIVLSGMIENLRQQTETRLYDDVANAGNLNWQVIKNPHPYRTNNPAEKMENLNLSDGAKHRYMSVVLKNSNRLKNLVKWLYSQPDKAKQLKILIIDDEADQASINTKKMYENDSDVAERTRINQELINLVHGYSDFNLKAVNYISYTATPYANVLNESNEMSLYPADFIITLEQSSDYIGPKQIFGLRDPETNPPIDITRDITYSDEEQLKQIHEGSKSDIPTSLKRAIQWYLISAMSMQINGHIKPISMLVHTSQKIADHENIEFAISKYFEEIKKDRVKFLEESEDLFNRERVRFPKKHFIAGMENYSLSEDEINDYPEWYEIEKYLKALLSQDQDNYLSKIKIDENGKLKYHRGIHLCIDNSSGTGKDDEQVRLVYPSKGDNVSHATLFIVIGGNTLSRGLTLEGLTTSYFMRNTVMSDSLMQMGRWFGYRFGYEIFPRIWLNSDVRNRFYEIAQIDEELREETKEFNRNGLTPRDVGVKVQNSLNNAFLKITSNNKMQGALETDLNFEGIQRQTIVFEDEEETLKHNIDITDKFLNELNEPIHSNTRLVWKDVPFDVVRDKFLKRYVAPESDIMFSNLKEFIDWCEQNDGESVLDDWNIILSSKGYIKNSVEKGEWDIKGYGVRDVSRTVLHEVSTEPRKVSIGALRSPKDLLTDIVEADSEDKSGTKRIDEVKEIREKYGYDKTPQLVIYRIDKSSKPQKSSTENYEKKGREELSFSEDIIGISIMIPGMRNSTNLATKLRVNVSNNQDDFTENEED